MVVVILVALLAVMAVPALKGARDDRACFNYAREYAQIIHRARTRAASTGAAQLAIIDTAGGIRGTIYTFQANNTGIFLAPFRVQPPEPLPQPQPNCRVPNQWLSVPGFVPPGFGAPEAPVQEGTTLTSATTGDTFYNIASTILIDGVAQPTVALCYTPAGTPYIGAGGNAAGAIAAMYTAAPFSGVLAVEIRRRNAANVGIGLNRRVLVAGSAQPRIQSQ